MGIKFNMKFITSTLLITTLITISEPIRAMTVCNADLKSAPKSIPLFKLKLGDLSGELHKTRKKMFIKNINPRDKNLNFGPGISFFFEKNKDTLMLNVKDNAGKYLGLVSENDVKIICRW